jgi:exocyst complex component 4
MCIDILISFSRSDHLKSVPDVLETLISEKRLLQASVHLVRSLKTINKQDMLEIGAVTDLRSYLVGQETVSVQFRCHCFGSIE